jgi:hypothetical protein
MLFEGEWVERAERGQKGCSINTNGTNRTHDEKPLRARFQLSHTVDEGLPFEGVCLPKSPNLNPLR